MLIVNFRTPDLTIEAVRSALAQPEATQIIVVDNAGGDDSVPRLQAEFKDEPRVEIIASAENVGFGRGNNLGAKRATQPFLFLLNSDAFFHEGCLSKLLAHWKTLSNPGILAPSVHLKTGGLQEDAIGPFPSAKRLILRQTKRYGTSLEPDWVSGCAMLLLTDDYRKVGGFDPEIFMYYEDVLLCRSIRNLGKGIHRYLEAGVTHLGGGSYTSDWKKKKQYYHAQDLLLRKLGEGPLAIGVVKLLRWPNLVIGAALGRR